MHLSEAKAIETALCNLLTEITSGHLKSEAKEIDSALCNPHVENNSQWSYVRETKQLKHSYVTPTYK